MTSTTASEVASMQADLDAALAQVYSLEHSLAALVNERDMLRQSLFKSQGERDYWMIRATEQSAILEGTANTLITGINKHKAATRARQEENLGVGGGNPPSFLTRSEPQTRARLGAQTPAPGTSGAETMEPEPRSSPDRTTPPNSAPVTVENTTLTVDHRLPDPPRFGSGGRGSGDQLLADLEKEIGKVTGE